MKSDDVFDTGARLPFQKNKTMQQPDFEKILEKSNSGIGSMCKDEFVIHKVDAIKAMKEVWNLAVETCAESAEVERGDITGNLLTIVDKQSILKNRIE